MRISGTQPKTIIGVFLALFIVFLGMRAFDAPLKNEVSPGGIVSFEFAKELSRAVEIMESWDVHARTSAGMSMGLDFLFIILYTSFLILLLKWTAKKSQVLNAVNKPLQLLLLLAAFCDVVENMALIQLLRGHLDQIWSLTAYYMAFIKFGIIALVLAYLLIQGLSFLIKKYFF